MGKPTGVSLDSDLVEKIDEELKMGGVLYGRYRNRSAFIEAASISALELLMHEIDDLRLLVRILEAVEKNPGIGKKIIEYIEDITD